jgi:hypothetical protein
VLVAGLALAIGSMLGTLAGCQNTNRSTGADPLLGGPPVRPIPQGKAPSTGPVSALPVPASPTTGTSPAALASIAPRQYDADRDLRIGPAPGSPNSDGWVRQDTGPRSDGSGALLRAPESITEQPGRREAVPVSNPPPQATARVNTFEQAQLEFARHGVIWQRLENTGANENWKFSCAVPSPQNRAKNRVYEVSRADALSAMLAVLDQIDHEQ